MRRTTRFLAAAFCAVIAMALSAAPAAADGHLERVIIRVSADLPPPPHPTAIAMEWFKEQVESEFPEGSEVRNFYAGSLYKDPEAITYAGERFAGESRFAIERGSFADM